MATYKEGLAYSSDEMKAIYTASSNEAYVAVTSDREITVEPDSYIAGVAGDHNSNPVRFRCDRYVDGGDLAACNHFYAAWQNPTAKTSGRTEMSAVSVDPDNANKIICIWLVDYKTCLSAGNIEIILQAVQEDADGSIVYEWQSKLDKSMKVLDGIDGTFTEISGDSDADYGIDEDELIAMLTEVLV